MSSGRGLGNPCPRERPKRWIHLPLPCVGTSFRASAASGLSHSPPGPPVPPGRRVSRLWQDDCTYIISAIPDWEYVSAYAATGLHPQRTTPLHGYTPTGLHAAAQPNGGRAAHGRPRAMLPFLREVPSGPPESRLHLQAFIRNRAARLKIPGLNREASPAFPLTLCVNIKRRARASAFAETRAKICATEMTG